MVDSTELKTGKRYWFLSTEIALLKELNGDKELL